MSARLRTLVVRLPWLAGFVLVACATEAPRSSAEPAHDAFYDGLSAEGAAVARQAVQQALESRPSDETFRWAYGIGSSGSVTPLRTFRIKTGHYCRDYSETIAKHSERVSALRTACRDSQGTWRVVKR